jgi:hypothetical protein
MRKALLAHEEKDNELRDKAVDKMTAPAALAVQVNSGSPDGGG